MSCDHCNSFRTAFLEIFLSFSYVFIEKSTTCLSNLGKKRFDPFSNGFDVRHSTNFSRSSANCIHFLQTNDEIMYAESMQKCMYIGKTKCETTFRHKSTPCLFLVS